MTRDGIIFGIAGTCFGLIVGWIVGSQQGGVRPVTTAAAVTQSAPAGAPNQAAPPPIDLQQAAALEQQAKAAPADAAVRAQLGNLYFDGQRFDLAIPWYEASHKLAPKDINVSTDLGGQLLLHRAARQGAGPNRPVARPRSEAPDDAVESGHHSGVRQAGFRRRHRVVGQGDRLRAEQSGCREGQNAQGSARIGGDRHGRRSGRRSRGPRGTLARCDRSPLDRARDHPAADPEVRAAPPVWRRRTVRAPAGARVRAAPSNARVASWCATRSAARTFPRRARSRWGAARR